MNKSNIKELLQKIDLKNIREAGDWIMSSCPFSSDHKNGVDKKPSFGIIAGKTSSFNCFSCHRNGNITSLPTILSFKYGINTEKIRKFIIECEGSDENLREEIETNYGRMCGISVSKLDEFEKVPDLVLKKLKLSRVIADKYDLRFDRKSLRLLFPVKDDKGRLVGVRGRYLGKDENIPRFVSYSHLSLEGKDPKSFGIWYLINEIQEGRSLVLVEGERDALMLKQHTNLSNIWASLGANLSKNQIRTLKLQLKSFSRVIVFFDDDTAGKSSASKLINEIKNIIDVCYVGDYCGCKDPAEICEKGLISKAINSVKKLN